MIRRLLVLFSLFISCYCRSQVLINEVSSAGVASFTDEDGDAEDWIEFYNAGSQTVNMLGYKITCYQDDKLKSWTFPQIFIPAHGRITVFFSGKNRRDYFDHWEIPAYFAFPWRYMPGFTEPPANWNTVGFNDSGWSLGLGAVGYGDGDDSSVVAPTISVYQRYSFTISDTSKIVMAALLLDFDDGFVAYLNGKEVARYNVGAQGIPSSHLDYAFEEHEANLYQNGNWSGLFLVPSTMLDSIILPGTNTLAIQTHNFSGGMDDLSMLPALLIGVADTNVTYYPFPADIRLHTDFELNSGGQLLTLYTPLGAVSDQQAIGAIGMGHSRGRQPDASNNWCLFSIPTPDTVNYSTNCYSGYGPSPEISLVSGFYSGTQMTSITAAAPGTILYSRNGSDPLNFSNYYTYNGAFSIDSTQVVRASLIPSDPSLLPGPTVAASYFVNENISLPVVSLISDPQNLFDPYYGIYALGLTPDTLLSDMPFHQANFWQGWVRPADISYFDKDKNLQFQQPVSVRIQGNWSKLFPQKGLFIDCDENYRGRPINYRLFPDKVATSYSGFNVRNTGSDYAGARMRDILVQKQVEKTTSLDVMDGFPCVVFINGRYWGVYELREKQDKHFLQNNSQTDDDNVDFLQFDGNVIEGTNKGFFEMVNYITTADMTQQSSYDSASAMLDVPNFCDYFITETFVGNMDWLGNYTNNIKFWKPHEGPGKWRYVLWDADICFQSDTVNMLSTAINPPTQNPHSDLLRSMLANDTFREYFINRYADLLNTSFYPQNLLNALIARYYLMLPEMDRHFDLWGTGHSPYSPTCVQPLMDTLYWQNQVVALANIMYVRPYYVRNQVQSQFGLQGQNYVALQTYPQDAGTIHINTITPDSLPWMGVYFDGNPVTMTAEPKPGYKFMYWEYTNQAGTHTSPVLRINVDTTMIFTAHFEPLEPVLEVYPNPFADELTINYELSESGVISLRVYDVTGRLVTEIQPADYQSAGPYTLHVSAGALGLSGGMYFFELRTPTWSKTVKMVGGRPKP
jgi:hypothetical protein